MSIDLSNEIMIQAVRKGDLQMVTKMIDTYGMSHSIVWSGYPLLYDDLRCKQPKIAKELLTTVSSLNFCDNEQPTTTLLHLAAECNNIQIVDILLQKHANVNAYDEHNSTPLHSAVRRGNAEMVTSLLRYGANVHAKDLIGYTPLHYAIRGGHVEIVKSLLSMSADVEATTSYGETPLHLVPESGNTEIAETLLNHGANVNVVSYSPWDKGYRPLHYASAKSNEKLVQLLLSRGAEINATAADDETALLVAVQMDKSKIVKVLCEYEGCDLNPRDKDGKTILHIAIEKGNLTIIGYILEFWSDVDIKNYENCLRDVLLMSYGSDHEHFHRIIAKILGYGFSVNSDDARNSELLHAVVEKGCLEILKDLLHYGADVNSVHPNREGYTLLHNAANNMKLEVAKLLINGTDFNAENKDFTSHQRIDINGRDKFGRTPLHYAISPRGIYNEYDTLNNTDVTCYFVEILLNQGAEVNLPCINGKTPLYGAVDAANLKAIEILLENNADINTTTDYQMITVLNCAVKKGHEAMCKMLLDKGARINEKGKKGKTALHVACQKQHVNIVSMLLKYGAEIDPRDDEAATPLQIAARKGSLGIVKILLNNFAEIEARDEYDKTALHIASEYKNGLIIAELLRYGANVNATCVNGKTPLSYAVTITDRPWDNPVGGRITLERIADILIRHIIMIRALNLYVNKEDSDLVDRHWILQEFEDICKDEVEMMKNGKIGDTNVSCYDILTKGVNQLAIYARNERFVETLRLSLGVDSDLEFNDSSVYSPSYTTPSEIIFICCDGSNCQVLNDYRPKIPVYSTMIHDNIKKGQIRGSLLNRSTKPLNFLLDFTLPELASEEILSNLSNRDLDALIKAGPKIDSIDSEVPAV